MILSFASSFFNILFSDNYHGLAFSTNFGLNVFPFELLLACPKILILLKKKSKFDNLINIFLLIIMCQIFFNM